MSFFTTNIFHKNSKRIGNQFSRKFDIYKRDKKEMIINLEKFSIKHFKPKMQKFLPFVSGKRTEY